MPQPTTDAAGALPEPVAAAAAARPDCSVDVEQATRIVLRGAAGERTEAKRWYLACPGERRRLVHEETKRKPIGIRAGSGDASADAGASDADADVFGRGGGGGRGRGDGDLPGGLESFLRDFLGGGGSLPPQQPRPRIGGGGGGGGGTETVV